MRALLPLLMALAGCAIPSGRDAPPVPLPDPAGPPLEEKAAAFERALDEGHLLPWGALGYRVRVREGKVEPVYGADTVAWTGALLGAECERWAATGDPAALRRVGTLLGGLETLAAVTGRPGLLARYAAPAGFLGTEPRTAEWREGAAGFEGWRWRGDLSKDQIAGLVYGLTAVTDFVADEALRARAARLLEAVADRLVGRGGIYEDDDGGPTTYGDVRDRVAGLPVGVNAAILLGVAHGAARATGEPRHGRRLDALLRDGAADALPFATVRLFGKENFNAPNMAAMALASILREDRAIADPRLRGPAEEAMRRILLLHRGEGTAFWLGIGAPAGLATRRDLADARAQLHRFPLARAEFRLDHAGRADLRRASFASKRGRAQFRHPLPVDLLGPGSFCWKTNCYEVLQTPAGDGRTVYSGADFLAAYWPLKRQGILP
jgi:hypothetical protein